MPKRDWRPTASSLALGLLALAIWSLLIWSVAYQQAYRTDYKNYATGQSAEDARQEIEHVCAALTVPAEYTQCVERVLGTERDNRRADNDLKAQESMAFWATLLTIATMVQIVIGGIGLFLLVGAFEQGAVQLRNARKANVAATRANLATREVSEAQIREARRLGEAQVRAYVTCTKCEVVRVGAATKPSAKATIKNSGQSPAAVVRVKISVGVERLPQMNNVMILVWNEESTRGLAASGEDEVSATAKYPLSAEDFASIEQGKSAVFVYVEISYIDVFGKQNDVEQRFLYANGQLKRRTREADVATYGNRFRWGYKDADNHKS